MGTILFCFAAFPLIEEALASVDAREVLHIAYADDNLLIGPPGQAAAATSTVATVLSEKSGSSPSFT